MPGEHDVFQLMPFDKFRHAIDVTLQRGFGAIRLIYAVPRQINRISLIAKFF